MMNPNDPTSDEDPEKPADQSKKPQPDPRKFKATPAFDLSDEDEINEMRQALIDQDAKSPGAEKSENDDPSFKAAGEKLPEQEPEKLDRDLNQSGIGEPVTAGNEPGLPSRHSFAPFDDDDFDFSVESEPSTPENLNEKAGPEFPNPEQAQSQSWDQIYAQDAAEDDLTQRINALRIENTQPLLSQTPVTPPFVMDEFSGLDENTGTLPDKIRKGQVPPETLQLLITQSMGEAEVMAVSRELGVDWNLIPGKNREDKVQFLVDYFRNKDNSTDVPGKAVHEVSNPIFLTRSTEEDWRESDSRLQALQETLNLPGLQGSEQKVPIFTRLKDDFDQASRLAKGLAIGLSVFAIILTVVILYFLFTLNNRSLSTPAPLATATISADVPFPKMVQFPGGWTFNLEVGLVKNGSWDPVSAEWLQGTEVCRMVSLPWSKQLNAVFQTFTAGDEILLTMSNQDILSYKVETTKTIKLNELDQLTNRDSPCMIVILTQKETDARQVIISAPSISSNTGVTAVPTIRPLSVTPTLDMTSAAPALTETPGKQATAASTMSPLSGTPTLDMTGAVPAVTKTPGKQVTATP